MAAKRDRGDREDKTGATLGTRNSRSGDVGTTRSRRRGDDASAGCWHARSVSVRPERNHHGGNNVQTVRWGDPRVRSLIASPPVVVDSSRKISQKLFEAWRLQKQQVAKRTRQPPSSASYAIPSRHDVTSRLGVSSFSVVARLRVFPRFRATPTACRVVLRDRSCSRTRRFQHVAGVRRATRDAFGGASLWSRLHGRELARFHRAAIGSLEPNW